MKINEDNRLYLDHFIIVIALPALFYDCLIVWSGIILLALSELLCKTAKRDRVTQNKYFYILLLSLLAYVCCGGCFVWLP